MEYVRSGEIYNYLVIVAALQIALWLKLSRPSKLSTPHWNLLMYIKRAIGLTTVNKLTIYSPCTMNIPMFSRPYQIWSKLSDLSPTFQKVGVQSNTCEIPGQIYDLELPRGLFCTFFAYISRTIQPTRLQSHLRGAELRYLVWLPHTWTSRIIVLEI